VREALVPGMDPLSIQTQKFHLNTKKRVFVTFSHFVEKKTKKKLSIAKLERFAYNCHEYFLMRNGVVFSAMLGLSFLVWRKRATK
jgi:hypothetical protein